MVLKLAYKTMENNVLQPKTVSVLQPGAFLACLLQQLIKLPTVPSEGIVSSGHVCHEIDLQIRKYIQKAVWKNRA